MRVFPYSLKKYNGMARHFYLAYTHTHTYVCIFIIVESLKNQVCIKQNERRVLVILLFINRF